VIEAIPAVVAQTTLCAFIVGSDSSAGDCGHPARIEVSAGTVVTAGAWIPRDLIDDELSGVVVDHLDITMP